MVYYYYQIRERSRLEPLASLTLQYIKIKLENKDILLNIN